ncbi:MAG: hypothetical protein HQL32_06745 [Planctomycetes bacterium]|nr:hypothetical protein [Planctomycetota bacterium]
MRKIFAHIRVSYFLLGVLICFWGHIKAEIEVSPSVKLGEWVGSNINESSGIEQSGTGKNVYWTHNDNSQNWIACARRNGKKLGRLYFTHPLNNLHDAEDMAIGPGPEPDTNYIYYATIGDNSAARHNGIYVLRMIEPDIDGVFDELTVEAEAMHFVYPDGPRDAESMFVDPLSKDIYIFSKREKPTKVFVARYPQALNQEITLEYLGDLPRPVNRGLTGADISRDGKHIIACTHYKELDTTHFFYWKRDGNQSVFDALSQKPQAINTDAFLFQREAVCWNHDTTAFYATTEGSMYLTSYAVKGINTAPTIDSLTPEEASIETNQVLQLEVSASDDEQDELFYQWEKVSGSGNSLFSSDNTSSSNVSFDSAGNYSLQITVSDGNLSVSASIAITVNIPEVSYHLLEVTGGGLGSGNYISGLEVECTAPQVPGYVFMHWESTGFAFELDNSTKPVISFIMPDHELSLSSVYSTDKDGDGKADHLDLLNNDIDLSMDSDNDGVPDFRDDDLDGDGILNALDISIDGKVQSWDSDNDGIDNKEDFDDDNDGVSDRQESLQGTSTIMPDTNGDGTQDNQEKIDTDNDGLNDYIDPMPHIHSMESDIDSDGVADEFDNDKDGDGIQDSLDLFVYDFDGDKLYNTVDLDDDGDGILDQDEPGALSFDYDNDGLIFDNDVDNDGISNDMEFMINANYYSLSSANTLIPNQENLTPLLEGGESYYQWSPKTDYSTSDIQVKIVYTAGALASSLPIIHIINDSTYSNNLQPGFTIVSPIMYINGEVTDGATIELSLPLRDDLNYSHLQPEQFQLEMYQPDEQNWQKQELSFSLNQELHTLQATFAHFSIWRVTLQEAEDQGDDPEDSAQDDDTEEPTQDDDTEDSAQDDDTEEPAQDDDTEDSAQDEDTEEPAQDEGTEQNNDNEETTQDDPLEDTREETSNDNPITPESTGTGSGGGGCLIKNLSS